MLWRACCEWCPTEADLWSDLLQLSFKGFEAAGPPEFEPGLYALLGDCDAQPPASCWQLPV